MATSLIHIVDDKFRSDGEGKFFKMPKSSPLSGNVLVPSGVLVDLDIDHSVLISKEFIDFYCALLNPENSVEK